MSHTHPAIDGKAGKQCAGLSRQGKGRSVSAAKGGEAGADCRLKARGLLNGRTLTNSERKKETFQRSQPPPASFFKTLLRNPHCWRSYFLFLQYEYGGKRRGPGAEIVKLGKSRVSKKIVSTGQDRLQSCAIRLPWFGGVCCPADTSECYLGRSFLQLPLYLGFCSLAPPIRLERNSALLKSFFVVLFFALLQKGSLQGQESTHSLLQEDILAPQFRRTFSPL